MNGHPYRNPPRRLSHQELTEMIDELLRLQGEIRDEAKALADTIAESRLLTAANWIFDACARVRDLFTAAISRR